MADSRVGISEAATPTHYVDNTELVNDNGDTVQRQRIVSPEELAVQRQLLESLQRFGAAFDPQGRLFVRLTDSAGTAQAVSAAQSGTWNVGTVTTVTTVAGITNLGGYAANPMVFSAMQAAANVLRAGIIVS